MAALDGERALYSSMQGRIDNRLLQGLNAMGYE
jgi:hypothetical protein